MTSNVLGQLITIVVIVSHSTMLFSQSSFTVTCCVHITWATIMFWTV